jgi:hypothetical protein
LRLSAMISQGFICASRRAESSFSRLTRRL